ncbi:hypothetical protein QVD17_06637 [Tagetes erecta]|uniref:EF-hand domain-containing protein n=1 Tax=Tagetes erecta TaxID=13708 RepID=A0AAD8P6P0_TARER|nr:hypothetical protein QVD17_06637 [Tagetes erecta]
MSFLIIESIQYFFLLLVLNRVARILKYFSSRSNFYVHKVENTTHDSRLSNSHILFTKTIVNDESVLRDDLELLMADLGVSSHPGGEKLPKVMNSTYIFNIFEAEQPRLDEVKQAFDVFDENKDGFIDARELQRVLCVMGLKERSEIEDCRTMIRAFDQNADGRIDFDEFVKLMENGFC